jgi:LacI family transcriptional regulator
LARRATIHDVAREAEVSIASASRALNGSEGVTKETRARVLAAAKRLRYVPNVGARSLITKRTGMVGVLLPDMYGEFFSELIRGIDAGARAKGLHLFVSSTHGDANEAAAVIHAMRGRVDGMIVMSPHVDEGFLSEHSNSDFPTVLVNMSGDAHVPSVKIDNRRGAEAMVRHLFACGHRTIALIKGPKGNIDADERFDGFRRAMRALKLRPGPILDGDFTETAGREAGMRLCADGALPDAVFALNDMMAIGCLGALSAAGIKVPQDVALAGFDDIPIAAYVQPGLTTMRVDIARLGDIAFSKLALAIAGAVEFSAGETIVPELVVRGSSHAESSVRKQGRKS